MIDKEYISADGVIKLRNSDITHVCIAPNIFPLLQYLLLMNDDIIFCHTYYFVNELISEEARKKIPCSCYNYYGKSFAQKINRRFSKIKLKFGKYFSYPFLKNAEIFAYDIPYLSLCIGNRPYSMLSDAPNWVTLNMQPTCAEFIRQRQKANSFIGRLQRFVFGDLFVNFLGNNKQSKAFYLTEENISPILEGKEVYIQSLESLYEQSSAKKREFIMDMFGVRKEDIIMLNQKPNLFFSQPLINDCSLTENEYIEILRAVFQHYPIESIIVKTHPRDNFNYKKYFPNITMYTKQVNSQLLSLIGVKPRRIITISSTAIEGFPETIECDYFGVAIHPKIEKCYGKDYKPNRKVHYMTK